MFPNSGGAVYYPNILLGGLNEWQTLANPWFHLKWL